MKTVLITGANKSIGFETARQLLQKGYFVYLGSRDLEKGNEAVAKLKAEGLTNVEAIQINVTDTASIAAARKQVVSLDILINNAKCRKNRQVLLPKLSVKYLTPTSSG
jgi:NAD(P)-dependent dehydrogenase (short-subunit alcohol dehydrogenase family)